MKAVNPQYHHFAELFRQTKDRLYHFAYKLTRNPDDAKDIVQEAYSRLWEKLPTIDTDTDVLPLLLTYARNCFIDNLRKRERDASFLDNLLTTTPVIEAAGAQQALELKDKQRQLQESLDLLPAKRRQIFTLVKEKGLTHKEAADQLGIATATVEKQISLSLSFLRKELNL